MSIIADMITTAANNAKEGFKNIANMKTPNIDTPVIAADTTPEEKKEEKIEEEEKPEEEKEEEKEAPWWKRALEKGSHTLAAMETPKLSTPNIYPSDERLKELFNGDDRIGALAEIHSYDFTYKPQAQEALDLDGDLHTGVIAQDIEKNPNYKGCVLDNGEYKALKVPELTAANTANIGDLARAIEDIDSRLKKLEDIIGER